ncbi:MAG TPA: prealbumin-like fold domain-containing protein [Acidimicrobiales bacterium]|nr:prealbumin-like fold domain-containing protein [Acidimicrobiales bacterium]
MRPRRMVSQALRVGGTLVLAATLGLVLTTEAGAWTTTGQVRVIKTDNAGKPLTGAGFSLYTVGVGDTVGTATKWSCQITKVSAGVASCTTSDDITPSQYFVVETTTPAGYLAQAPLKITITAETLTTVHAVDDPQPPATTTTTAGPPATTTLPPSTTTAPPPPVAGSSGGSSTPIVGATTVHTGEAWAGALPVVVALGLLGLVTVTIGEHLHRRTRSD